MSGTKHLETDFTNAKYNGATNLPGLLFKTKERGLISTDKAFEPEGYFGPGQRGVKGIPTKPDAEPNPHPRTKGADKF